jgi:death-on-curing protein
MIKDTYRYFTIDYVIKEHDFIISESGGIHGVKDIGLVESVLAHIKNDDYYPEFLDKITHIVFGINKSHAFNDGNKRTSIALSAFFLGINDHDAMIKQYTEGMEEVAIWVAKSFIDKDLLSRIIEFLLYDDKGNIYYFIEQAKRYKDFIEPDKAPIGSELLCAMANDWIGDEPLSEENKLKLLEAITKK